jgi:hypothetical protein
MHRTPLLTQANTTACGSANLVTVVELLPMSVVHSLLEEHTQFLSRSQHVDVVAIPKRFSSSSLPPSFASGRCVTAFLEQATANRGGLFHLCSAL